MSYYIIEASDGDILVKYTPDGLNLATVLLSPDKIPEKIKFAAKKLAKVFSNLPDNITMLDLGGNKLGLRPTVELKNIISELPSSITSLDLSNNYFNPEHLEIIADWAAKHVKIKYISGLNLDLDNNINNNIINIQKALDKNIFFDFSDIPGSDYINMFDLSNNNLSTETGSRLAQAFISIPNSVTMLNLANTKLDKMADIELEQAFFGIGPGVVKIDLTNNCFNTTQLKVINKLVKDHQNIIDITGIDNSSILASLAHNKFLARYSNSNSNSNSVKSGSCFAPIPQAITPRHGHHRGHS